MPTFEISTPSSSLALGWEFDGDYLVSLEATVNGFKGHSSGHVEKQEFERFLNDIAQLNKTLKGHAEFSSVVFDIFAIRFEASDGLGHLAVRGRLSIDEQDLYHSSCQSLSFRFDLDSNQLETIVNAQRAT